ncbi:MAG: SDR family oxidoreductase [Microbacterium gubbeenense]
MTSSARVAWVTGAGSGMGAASAEALSTDGFAVALTGRGTEALESVAARIRGNGGMAIVVPADVTDRDELRSAIERVVRELGPPTTVVLSAGANTPRRHWDTLTSSEMREIVDVNLMGIVEPVELLLPAMRRAGGGQIIIISSWSAWRFSPGAGVAYSASKQALAAVAETINAQEGRAGIRACHLCPGDVDTGFLEYRPQQPTAADRGRMLAAADVARAVSFVAASPAGVCINELVITPTANLAYG